MIRAFVSLCLLASVSLAHAVPFLPSPLPANSSVEPDLLNLGLDSDELENLLQLISKTQAPPQLKPDLPVHFNPKDLENPEDWKRKYFDVVVVVDKSPSVQRATIYRDGKVERVAKVSTGREQVELVDPSKSGSHSLTHDTVTQTYTGYFTPTLLDIDHVSNSYQDAKMPWSVFFNLPEGEATHQAPGGTEGHLGHRASGGCVRMFAKDARDLFWWVRMTGGPFTANELGKRQFVSESRQWLALGHKPNDALPQIPRFSRTGVVETDVTTGQPAMHGGYKTLYIVLNSSPVKAKVPKAKPPVAI
jgi:hypothetical protein